MGDDLKDSVAAGVNPIWVAQHVKVMTENNNKKHFPEQPIVDEDALHLGFDREGEEPNVSAGDLVVDETNETSGSSSSSSGQTTVSEPRTPTPPTPEGEVVNNDPTGMEMYRSQSSVETLVLFQQIGNSPGTNIRIQQDRRKRRAAQEAESKRSKKQKLHDDDSVVHLAKIEEESCDDEAEVQIGTKTDREKVKAAVLPKKTVALKTKKPPVKKVKQTSSSSPAANLPTMVKRTSGRSTRSKNLNLREVVDPAAEQDDDSPYEASSDKSDTTPQVGTITKKTKRQYGKKTKTLELMSPIEESSILVPKKKTKAPPAASRPIIEEKYDSADSETSPRSKRRQKGKKPTVCKDVEVPKTSEDEDFDKKPSAVSLKKKQVQEPDKKMANTEEPFF